MEFSIIVPVYNAEKYLSRCLDSILQLQDVDWECILIDDGSMDKSAEIIETYARMDSRFVTRHIRNDGVSNARNTGLDCATGRICMFLDADDWLCEGANGLLHRELQAFQPEILTAFAYQIVKSNGETADYAYPAIKEDSSYAEQLKTLMVCTQSLNPCWAKLYSRDLIQQHNIRFNTAMKIGEDACFVMEYLKHVSGIRICKESLLCYRANPQGAMGSIRLKATVDMKETMASRKQCISFFQLPVSRQEYSMMYSKYAFAFIRYALNECACTEKGEFIRMLREYREMSYVQEFLCGCSGENFNFLYKMILKRLQKKKFETAYRMMKLVNFVKKR